MALSEGPQIVTRDGEELVVVVSARKFQELTEGKHDFKDFLLLSPDLSTLDLDR